jgi:hypothetical protein
MSKLIVVFLCFSTSVFVSSFRMFPSFSKAAIPRGAHSGLIEEGGDAYVRQLIAQKPTDERLYTLKDISTTRAWNYELPTLTKKQRFLDRKSWNSAVDFRESFYSKFPIFKHVDLSNIAVMGGGMFDILHSREDKIADIDLFLCGDLFFKKSENNKESLEAKIVQRAEKFIDDVYRSLEDYVKDMNNIQSSSWLRREIINLSDFLDKFQANRKGPVITFHIPNVDVPIQLVLCPHENVTMLLREVDLDCTAIAYHENEVYFNSISKFCYENACTILSEERNKYYEPRLSKYFEKGVDIILPDANVEKFPRKNLKFEVSEVTDLAYLGIIYNEIAEKRVFTDKLVAYHPSSSTEEDEKGFRFEIEKETSVEEEDQKDEEDDEYTDSVYSVSDHVEKKTKTEKTKPAGVIVHENIIHLIHDLPQRFQYHGEGKYVKDVLLPIPKLTNRMITNSFQTVLEIS